MDKLRDAPSPPVMIGSIAIAVVALLALLYFGVLKPKLEADRAVAEFSSPEAEAKRDPAQRKIDPDFARAVQQMKAKERHATTGAGLMGQRER
jgi:hypothetical protein